MGYRVLAQKYRPQVFEDVIGQETVNRTLKNSIKQERIANAYIFCGPRGVGKTTIARLLAKTLNCEEPPEKAPCNKCSSCIEITKGNSIDVMEIDGASNNRVDEIRVLLENVQFSPSKGKYKIYIIDEVHMLSPGAFNALLKTLEEPPEHVKFIFATTEHHKVLPTILSRCQRFDFKRIPPKLILDRLMDIAKKEQIGLDADAALIIARSADGSLRDGLVVLDQMISFSGGKIMPQDVVELLGMVGKDKIFEISNNIINKDAGAVLTVLDEMIDNGKDPVFIANTLINHFRDIMVLKNTNAPTIDMAFSEDEMSKIKVQIDKLSKEEILYILQNLTHLLLIMKSAMFSRAPLEIALVKLTKRGEMLSLAEILDELKKKDLSFEDIPVREDRTPTSSSMEKNHIKTESIKSPMVPKKEVVDEDLGATDTEDDENYVHGNFNWKDVLKYVKSKKISVFTFLSPARPLEVNDSRILIGFSKEHAFNKEVIETEVNRKFVEEAISKIAGKDLRVEFTVAEDTLEDSKEIEKKKQKMDESREKMKPVIEKAMDVFGGHVVRDYTEES